MRTFAARQRDLQETRYEGTPMEVDPKTTAGAKATLATRGGKNAARVAIKELWAAACQWSSGYLPTAKISAPLRVLEALETMGVIERADDDRGEAIRFRLTQKGLRLAGWE